MLRLPPIKVQMFGREISVTDEMLDDKPALDRLSKGMAVQIELSNAEPKAKAYALVATGYGLELNNPWDAVKVFRRAVELYPRVGVKAHIKELEQRIRDLAKDGDAGETGRREKRPKQSRARKKQ